MDVTTDTINVYNDLYFATENLAVERRSLNLAKQTLHDNQRRAEIGVMSPLDIAQAQADEADREERVLVAERAVADAKNFLKQLITDQVDTILTTDVEITPPPFDLDFVVDESADLKRVLDLRPDSRQALLNLQKQNINLVFSRNQTLPQLDLVASLGLNGLDTSLGASASRLRGRARSRPPLAEHSACRFPIGPRAGISRSPISRWLNRSSLSSSSSRISLSSWTTRPDRSPPPGN